VPFLTEEIYQNLAGSGQYQISSSVHLTEWPEVESDDFLDQELIMQMELARRICELGHGARKKAKIRVRQPLKKLVVKAPGAKLADELLSLIKDELNVKEIVWQKTKVGQPEVKLDTKITAKLKAEGEAREMVRKVQELRRQKGCALSEKIIIYALSWPKEFEEQIMSQTLATEIKKGTNLRITASRK